MGTTMPGSTIASLKNRTGTDLASAMNPPKFSQIDSTLASAGLFPRLNGVHSARAARKFARITHAVDAESTGPWSDKRQGACRSGVTAGSLVVGGRYVQLSCTGLRPQHPLDIRQHLLDLLTPIAPAVRALRREVEHPVGAACRDIVVPEGN